MQPFFLILTGLVLMQRLIELRIAGRNARWMKKQRALEFGAAHYPLIVFVHVLFFIGLIIEVAVLQSVVPPWLAWCSLIVFTVAQIVRWWSIRTLGRFWNTRIIVLPGAPVVRHGPYRFVRHPNYVVVMVELLFFPLIFGAYITAVVVSVLNFVLLYTIRIPAEERALSAVTNDDGQTARKDRFLRQLLTKERS